MRSASGIDELKQKKTEAFSLIEVMVSMGVMGALIISLYAGIAWGFSVMRLARENIRATQILVEKMETIRLYNWDQVTTNGFLPRTFNVPYYPIGQSNGTGITYYGTLTVANASLGNSYDSEMRRVIVSLNWTNANLPRTRTITTLVSRYGLQNYIY